MNPLDSRHVARLLLLFVAGSAGGCGTYVAHRLAQAPSSYPSWLAPAAPVTLCFQDQFLTNFPAEFAEVGPPQARLHYRVVVPADYQLGITSTNWLAHGRKRVQYNVSAVVPGRTNLWTGTPRGTVVLLHGYGLAEFAMAPWALQLAQKGWQCVLVDLRGHGESTGDKIYFGTKEAGDLSQLLDALASRGDLPLPVAAMGESYGASLALRWQATDPRIQHVVAIAPYAVLSNAVLNIRREYAPCLPAALLKAGLNRLPTVLGVPPEELDPVTMVQKYSMASLFVVGEEDKIIPLADTQKLLEAVGPGSRLLIVPGATHETVPYCFSELTAPVLAWLNTNQAPNSK